MALNGRLSAMILAPSHDYLEVTILFFFLVIIMMLPATAASAMSLVIACALPVVSTGMRCVLIKDMGTLFPMKQGNKFIKVCLILLSSRSR